MVRIPVQILIALALLIPVAGFSQTLDITATKGKAIFRSNCAFCHGPAGVGGRGPNLHGTLTHGDRNADIAAVIKTGVAGTSMPAFTFEPNESAALVKFIQVLRKGSAPPPTPRGNSTEGARVYHAKGCASCHQIGAEGSTFGPNLSRVGAARSYEYLKQSVVSPSADVPDEMQGVSVTTAEATEYTGLRVNEDTFTIQVRLPDQSFRSFQKQHLKRFTYEKNSLMPAYHLAQSDLDNLLAFLSSLRGLVNNTADTRKAQGIR